MVIMRPIRFSSVQRLVLREQMAVVAVNATPFAQLNLMLRTPENKRLAQSKPFNSDVFS